jgi:hypothetical protein
MSFPKFDGLKELDRELRRTSFPIREEPLFTGTYRDPEKLYKPMIDAFSRGIAKRTKSELDEKSVVKIQLSQMASSDGE